ncbi:MAG: hypothetical protein OFPII_23080 [Osedax symbiont Rs1]|nr:MAG: hypothetical protein OFPII_23080 [Osedax symbiont Rs1]
MPETRQNPIKKNLHRKNIHNHGYDFQFLATSYPPLLAFLSEKHHQISIDYSDAAAVLALNTALLKAHYRIDYWQIPKGYLCPPIPGRADYIHYLADLIHQTSARKTFDQSTVSALDIGTGASCIYPLIGQRSYQWSFTASDIDPISVACASQIIQANPGLRKKIKVLLQPNAQRFFANIIAERQRITVTLCNPPFHSSLAEAALGNARKRANLQKKQPSNKSSNNNSVLNFGGQKAELYCEGGELSFIKSMIIESQEYKNQVLYFSCLVSKNAHLKALQHTLKSVDASDIKIVPMSQGHKTSRFIAWSFLNKKQREDWLSQA